MNIPAESLNSHGLELDRMSHTDHAWQMAVQWQAERDYADDQSRLGDVTVQRLDWRIDEHLNGDEQ